jgi:hypothetical protein
VSYPNRFQQDGRQLVRFSGRSILEFVFPGASLQTKVVAKVTLATISMQPHNRDESLATML